MAKEHLPSDIIDILERLRKADNITFNQLYYIAENCTDRYYSKVIKIVPSIQEHQEEPMPSISTTDHHSLNETPVHPVEPVLGMTPSENH